MWAAFYLSTAGNVGVIVPLIQYRVMIQKLFETDRKSQWETIMELTALITLALLIQYFAFTFVCGVARAKAGIVAPCCTGDENFERTLRVQQNTLEQLIMVLPAIWICALFFRPDVAAACGLVFFVARFIYRASYMNDPTTRTLGMSIGLLATAVLFGTSLWGIISKMV